MSQISRSRFEPETRDRAGCIPASPYAPGERKPPSVSANRERPSCRGQPAWRVYERDVMKRADGKAVRINQIERLLWSHPEGLTRTEVARRISVNRSVITKYLDQNDLPPSIYEDHSGNK